MGGGPGVGFVGVRWGGGGWGGVGGVGRGGGGGGYYIYIYSIYIWSGPGPEFGSQIRGQKPTNFLVSRQDFLQSIKRSTEKFC